MSFLECLLRLTAWPMTPPVLYGPFHLLAAFGGSAAAIWAAWLFSPKDHPNTNTRIHQQKFDRIMLISGVILLIGELYKQLMNFYVVNGHVYDWWIFPFQLCSLPMYLCPLLIMIHNEKRHRILCTFLLDFNMMGAVATFIDPSGIFHPVLDADTAWHPLASDVDFCRIRHYFQSRSRSYNQRLPSDTATFCLFLPGSRSSEWHPASLQRRQPVLYLPMGNVHPAALWRYRSDTRPSNRHSPVHSCDGYRRLAHS